MSQTATAHLLADRQASIETPEHVAIGYELADLGSRFTALLIDAMILILGMLGLWMGLYLVASVFKAVEMIVSLGMAVTMALSFLVLWGYFVFFEGLRDGQTPGKRWMGIRVVHDGGFPLTVRGAAVRNLMRIIDILPPPSWALGGLAMMLHPQTKRVGDLAAGTVVVRDRTGQPIPEEARSPSAVPLGRPRLSDDEFAALEIYASRREALDGAVRADLSRKLMSRVERHFAEDARRAQMSPDTYLAVVHEEELARRQASGAGGRAGTAQATALVRRQRRRWDEYQRLLDEARTRGLDQLGEAKVSRFAALYREMAADLARARTYGGSPELLYTMERLVGFGHNLLYRPPARSWRRFASFALGGFAALVRRRWRPILAASALFYLPALLTFAAVRQDPALTTELLGAGMLHQVEAAAEKEARGQGYNNATAADMPVFGTFVTTNNIRVAFTAFAGGILAGIGTMWILILNGVMLGSAAAAFANAGQSLHLWTFVLPHGVIEMTAICIAGGAGLWIGSALVLPGRRTRREVLATRGREAVSLIVGTALMLVVAGTIEGFVSPSPLPRAAKLAAAAVFALAMVAYFVFAGRGEEHRLAAEHAGER